MQVQPKSNFLQCGKSVRNDFYHPTSVNAMEDLEQGQHSVWLQVGSKLYPEYPIRDSTEAYYELSQTVKKPYAHIFTMVSYMQIHNWHGHGEDSPGWLYWLKY